MSDTDPYEREAAKAAIKVLQRELAEARELLIKCLSVMPVGYIPTHTAENLPEMINDLAKALAEETTKYEQLERELAEAREQRDALAEAAQTVVDRRDSPTWKGLEPTAEFINALRNALVSTKGGQHD